MIDTRNAIRALKDGQNCAFWFE